MVVDERGLKSLGPFPAGANNIALETSVPQRSFRAGINVDVTDDGKVVRRRGREKIFEVVEPANLFGYGNRGFFTAGGSLYLFEVADGRETPPVEITDQLESGALLAHAMIEPDLFVSDGAQNWRIGLDGFVSPWSLPTPDFPGLEVAVGGSLAAGDYMVSVAYKAMSGEEGPLSDPRVVTISDGSKLIVTLPPAVSGASRVAVYMTKPNGSELLLAASLPVNAPPVTFNKQQLGRPAVTQDTDPIPACAHACVWNGRLLVAYDNFVVWSEPNQYGVTKLMYNFLTFSEEVTMLAAVDTAGGFFVGQKNQVYFVNGADPADARLVSAYAFGAIPGTLQMVPGARLPFDVPPVQNVPIWVSTNGVFCVGMIDGSVQPLTETRFVTKHSERGAAMFDQRGGKNRYVATLRNPSDNAFAVSDQFTAEVVRNNIPS